MPMSEAEKYQLLPTRGWSAEEESIIATIEQIESVRRAEAIRRMQRRKKASSPVAHGPAVPTT